MSALEDLRKLSSRKEFAQFFGWALADLTYVLYALPLQHHYTTFEIEKRDGGVRRIDAPKGGLKDLQRRLADVLYECQAEIELKRHHLLGWRPLSHGFRRGHSIFSNAYPHRKQRYVLNLDIEDFFPSLNYGRVRGFS